MPLLFHTTVYKPHRAQAEIQERLVSRGAKRISLEYDQGKVIGISFTLVTPVGEREFLLPARVQNVLATMKRQGVLSVRRDGGAEHAEAVAWRTLLEWVKLQMALVETQQATLDEVMLPYLLLPGPNGKAQTLYQSFTQQALPQGTRS